MIVRTFFKPVFILLVVFFQTAIGEIHQIPLRAVLPAVRHLRPKMRAIDLFDAIIHSWESSKPVSDLQENLEEIRRDGKVDTHKALLKLHFDFDLLYREKQALVEQRKAGKDEAFAKLSKVNEKLQALDLRVWALNRRLLTDAGWELAKDEVGLDGIEVDAKLGNRNYRIHQKETFLSFTLKDSEPMEIDVAKRFGLTITNSKTKLAKAPSLNVEFAGFDGGIRHGLGFEELWRIRLGGEKLELSRHVFVKTPGVAGQQSHLWKAFVYLERLGFSEEELDLVKRLRLPHVPEPSH